MIPSLLFGFIGGIALGSFIPIDVWTFVACATLSGVFFIYRYFVSEEERKVYVICGVFTVALLFGLGRVYVSDLYKGSELTQLAGQKLLVDGIVVDDPDVRETNTKLTVKVLNVSPELRLGNKSSEALASNEKILVTTSMYPEFQYGDKVKMSVILREPSLIENEDGRVFDYIGYLRVRGIWYTASFTEVDLISSGHGNIIKSALFKTKHVFTDSIGNAIPEPESSLLAGLLLGTKQSLGKDILEEFQKTGTSHIVVLSGYNIAIVAESIMSFFKFMPKNFAFGAGVTGIILFIILSGGGASAWRAGIMVLVALIAKKFGRDYKASRVLAFVIVLMLAPNPLLLVFDPSFQLSILATIGLIFVSPLISPYLTKITERFGLREIVASTIATQITVLPFLIYNTGLLSLVSLPVNVLILSTIPLTMLLGFITGIFGLVSLYLSFIPALFAYALLWYQLTIVHIGASIPFGSIKLPAFSPVVLVVFYLIIALVLYFLGEKTPKKTTVHF